MKRILIASAVILPVATGQGMAQSGPGGPVLTGPMNWTGPYIGIGGGGAWGKSDQSDFLAAAGPPGPTGPTGPTGATGPTGPTGPIGAAGDGHYRVQGWLVGGTVGYNEQIGRMVFGIEGDLSYARVEGSSATCGVTPHECGTSLHSLATLRTRMGPTWDGLFIYLTGGLAFGEVSAFDSLFAVSGREWRIGWTFGGGLEVMFTPNWSVKVEYLHVDLGTGVLYDIVPGTPERVHFEADIVRAGLNFRFNSGPPPVRVKY